MTADAPQLDPNVAAHDETLAAAIDALFDADPEVSVRTWDLAMLQTELMQGLSAAQWALFVRIEERERALTLHLLRWVFNEGRRYPLTPTPGGVP